MVYMFGNLGRPPTSLEVLIRLAGLVEKRCSRSRGNSSQGIILKSKVEEQFCLRGNPKLYGQVQSSLSNPNNSVTSLRA